METVGPILRALMGAGERRGDKNRGKGTLELLDEKEDETEDGSCFGFVVCTDTMMEEK